MLTPRSLGACGFALAGLVAAQADAALLFSGSSGMREAEVSFDVSGGDLIVTLANSSGFDIRVPSDLLTAMFFNVTDGTKRGSDPLSLTPISAVLGSSSDVLFGVSGPGGNVGGEWAYRENLRRAPGRTSFGISSSGLGKFGPRHLFPGENLNGPRSPAGMNYALASQGDDPNSGNRPVTGKNPLIKYEVVFTLSGLEAGFDINRIENIVVQYGTSIRRRNGVRSSFFTLDLVPSPASALLLVMAGGVGVRRRVRPSRSVTS